MKNSTPPARSRPLALLLPVALVLTGLGVGCGGDGNDDSSVPEDVVPAGGSGGAASSGGGANGGGATGGGTTGGGTDGGGADAGSGFRVDPARAGSLFGTVSFEGTPPPRRKLGGDSEPGCDGHEVERLSQDWIVNDGKVQNVFLWLERFPDELAVPAVSADPVVLDQRGCIYTPHLSVARTGQKVLVKNSDGTNHNVNVKAKKNPGFNLTQGKGAPPLEFTFASSEEGVEFACDLHPWMSSHLCVIEHPFWAISAADGSWSIGGLPPGKYEVRSWHEESTRPKRAVVTLTAEGGIEIPFSYSK